MNGRRRAVLLAGETWTTHAVHVKGFGSYSTGHYEEGHGPLRDALLAAGIDFHHVPNHAATQDFPRTAEELARYDVVVLSDCPADTLLLHPDTFTGGRRTPNRLAAIADYVSAGGGFLMVGGYMSFGGIGGKANYRLTPLARVLPVRILPGDDRIEAPEGVTPTVLSPGHPVLGGLSPEWPWFLGYNKLEPGPDAEVLLEADGDPFLAVRSFGQGRTAAFASDCSPHWGSPAFLEWDGYGRFWHQLIEWLAGGKGEADG